MHHPFPPLLVRASAGSGKTYRLVVRFIGLLAAGVEPRRALATTFTRKAAGEILGRVMARLADAALDSDERTKLNGDLSPGLALDAAAAERLLGEVARALPELQVETLDAFFHRIAAGHAFELGLPPGWGIGDRATLARLRRRAIADLLERDPDAATELVRRLSKGEARRGVIEQVDALVLELHQRFVESPAEAWDSFAVPPPPRAGELERARSALADAPVPRTQKGTEHSNWRKAKDALLAILDEPDPLRFAPRLAAHGIVRKILDGESTYSKVEIPPEWSAALAAPIALARHRELDYLRDQNLASHELMVEYDACERARRDDAGRYDFGTVTRLLAESGWSDTILDVYERIDARIDHVLLDEFQDTSRLQYAVLRPIVDEVIAGAEDERTFFCVGDVKQAIYGWRGGCRALFDDVEEKLPPGSATSLDQSWRSSPVVLDAVNCVFGSLQDALTEPVDIEAGQAWQRRFHEHVAAHPERPGLVELRIASREEDEVELSARELPYLRAVDAVRRIHAADPRAEIGVLLRRNQRVRVLIDLLRENGIDASEEGGNPLSDSPAVNRILAALILADHPGDRSAHFAACASPLAAELGGGISAEPARVAAIARSLRRELLERGYGRTIARLVALLAPASDERDRARLEQLVELAHRIGDETGLRPAEFVERVRTTSVESPTGSPVKVMTIHGAKGLEFDAVVLPELADVWSTPTPTLLASGSDPARPADRLSRYASEDIRRLCSDALDPIHRGHRAETVTEALSVLYVALTRARHALHLLLPPGRLGEKPSFARILRMTLGAAHAEEDGSGECVLFRAGDEDWLARREKKEKKARAAPALAPRRERGARGEGSAYAASPPPPSARPPSRTRESEGASAGGRAARRFGTTVHQLLEGIEWLDETPGLAGALDRAAAAVASVARPHLAPARRALERALATPAARDALSIAPTRVRLAALAGEAIVRVEVAREVGYIVVGAGVPGGPARGIIDRLHIGWGENGPLAAEVIDAKTDVGGESAGAAAALIERYGEQMQAYRDAVAGLYGLAQERIAVAILAVPSGEVIPVGDP